MRLAAAIFGLACVGFGWWQRATLTHLREAERQLGADKFTVVPPSPTTATRDAESAMDRANPGLSPDEMQSIATAMRDFKVSDGFSAEQRSQQQFSVHADNLSRLSTAQLQTIIDQWTDGEPVTSPLYFGRAGALQYFMPFVARVNPEATIRALQEHPWELGKSESAMTRFVSAAFQAWYRRDRETMLAWVRGTSLHPSLKLASSRWMSAVAAIENPTTENVATYLGQYGADNRERYQRVLDRAALVREIRTSELRIAFFQSLAEATGGVSDEISDFVVPLAGRVSFGQIAHLGDSVPDIVPSANPTGSPGTLRQEIARLSRDATARERWSWLTKNERDMPTGKVLDHLVATWCDADYGDTAAWAQTLPAGPVRAEVVASIRQFLTAKNLRSLTAQWASPNH